MKENWGKVQQSLAKIDRAVAEGADLYLDAYPYCATSTTLLARFMPAQFHPPGTANVLSLLDDPKIVNEICAWGEKCWHNDLSWTLITSCPGHPEYAGMNLNEISDLRSQSNRMRTARDLVR